MSPVSEPLVVRFWRKVEKTDGCWKWHGGTQHGGYGVLGVGTPSRKLIRAHRLSYILANGPIADNAHVLHRCDNPPCTNPEHLFLGNPKVNGADRSAKGRNNHPGERKTHCRNGHPLAIINHQSGVRGCPVCRRERERRPDIAARKAAGAARRFDRIREASQGNRRVCRCGCGDLAKVDPNNGRPFAWVRGHHTRMGKHA